MIERKYLIASVIIVATLVTGMVYGISQSISHASPTLATGVEKIVVIDSFSYDSAFQIYGAGVRIYSDDITSPNYGYFFASYHFTPKSDFQEITDVRINLIWQLEGLATNWPSYAGVMVKFWLTGLTGTYKPHPCQFNEAHSMCVDFSSSDYSGIQEGLNYFNLQYQEDDWEPDYGKLWVYRLEILIEYTYFRE